ncbi:hypothetical protein [Brachybacterium kimchii]|uniref:DNA-binding protein n=1 Tax=Brachybacterium kimchii TaxID=2942909 RepID=A0ABY4NDQ7_9MICO|nr:hypothetical protein [Brachybacterium kimchii]UQN31774.1 hypothetical protein M4486_19485 [Brachybacterium kimchii]
MSTTWHARLTWVSTAATTTEQLGELMDDLADHAPSGSLSAEGQGGTVMIALEAATFDDALSAAITTVRDSLVQRLPGAAIRGIELLDSAALDHELEQPLFPEVVGFAEIAEMAGVSRQRARMFRDRPGFPAPVIETAQGPLMSKAAVSSWLASRNTRPGRPRGDS